MKHFSQAIEDTMARKKQSDHPTITEDEIIAPGDNIDLDEDGDIVDSHGQIRHMRLTKEFQINAPSHPRIIRLITLSTARQAGRTTFNGRMVSKQVYLNCLILGLHELGGEYEDKIFDAGAAILKAAERAGEVDVEPHQIRHQIFIQEKPEVGTTETLTKPPKKRRSG